MWFDKLMPCYTSAEDYLKAVAESKEMEPGEDKGYDWVADYAKDLVTRREKIASILDDKADAIIKYMGGGAGLFALGAIAGIQQGQGLLILWSLPALACALVSVFLATLARKPLDMPGLPKVIDAFHYANAYEEKEAKVKFLVGKAHATNAAWLAVCRAKAKRVEWATWPTFPR
jgi:hypothetical protein